MGATKADLLRPHPRNPCNPRLIFFRWAKPRSMLQLSFDCRPLTRLRPIDQAQSSKWTKMACSIDHCLVDGQLIRREYAFELRQKVFLNGLRLLLSCLQSLFRILAFGWIYICLFF